MADSAIPSSSPPAFQAPSVPAGSGPARPSPSGGGRTKIIVGILSALIVLVILVVGAVVLLRLSAEEDPVAPSETTNTLPRAEGEPIASPLEEAGPVSTQPNQPVAVGQPQTTPAAALPTPAATPSNLLVTIIFDRQAASLFQLGDAKRTRATETIQDYKPSPGAPYSLLQVKDANGQVLASHQFSMPTQAILEGVGVPEGPPLQINRSELALVVALPATVTPAEITIASTGGTTLATKTIVFSQLPEEGGASPVSLAPSSFTQRLKWLFPLAAEAQQGSGGRKFRIVVINHPGGNLASATQAANQMLTVEPWTTFKDDIEIISIENELPTGCRVIKYFGFDFPFCEPNPLLREAIINGLQNLGLDLTWNATVVAMTPNCDCGHVAALGNKLAVVGKLIHFGTLTHEFGHAIGKMQDEYLYRFGVTLNNLLPNCFASLSQCQSALEPYEPDNSVECSLGCSTTTSYRPSTRIMHNTPNPLEFGSFDQCIMGVELAALMGRTYDCPGSFNPGGDEDYWGWYKGG